MVLKEEQAGAELGQAQIKLELGFSLINPTTEGVQIPWVRGGGASEAPPKKSMIEWA